MTARSRALHQDVTLRLALLGDSIAYGTGARSRRDALGPRLAAALADQGVAAEAQVFAAPGARSSGLATQVDRALRWRPDVVVVVIGANDLTGLVPATEAAESLRAAVRGLRGAGARVVVAPAPDLSVVPHVPAALRSVVRLGSVRLRAAQVAAVLGEGGLVADVEGRTAAAFSADPGLFGADRFHPSSEGYAVIAEALSGPVLAAAGVRAEAAG